MINHQQRIINKETKKSLYKPTINSLFKLKREKIKKNINKPAKKNLFKSKIKNPENSLWLENKWKQEDRGNQGILYDPKNNHFKPEEDHYKPIRIVNAFSSNHIVYKSNRDKDKSLLVE